MRLWSLHPQYLDAKGLVALWREALLAQKVLCGKTQGYRHHPQLQRFTQHANPQGAIAAYLHAVQQEATRRGYRFDAAKIATSPARKQIVVSDGQLEYERKHLAAKLLQRDPAMLQRLPQRGKIAPHPFFSVVPGAVAVWEVIS